MVSFFTVIQSMKAAIRPSPNQNIDFCFCPRRHVVALILFRSFFYSSYGSETLLNGKRSTRLAKTQTSSLCVVALYL